VREQKVSPLVSDPAPLKLRPHAGAGQGESREVTGPFFQGLQSTERGREDGDRMTQGARDRVARSIRIPPVSSRGQYEGVGGKIPARDFQAEAVIFLSGFQD
jgi:hypothetical protein